MRRDSVRGVSDVVAFTLVFSTIIFTIGVITVTGVGTLGDVQAATETGVAEETMRNYAGSLSDHRTERAPRRSTTIKLQGHNLDLAESVELSYGVGGDTKTIVTGALVRTTDTDAELVYQSGGLFRVQDGGSVVVRQPPFRCGDDTAHLAVTTLRPRGDGISLASDSRLTLVSRYQNQSITVEETATPVSVDIGSTRYTEAWRPALEDDWDRVARTDTYECDVSRFVLHRTNVTIEAVN